MSHIIEMKQKAEVHLKNKELLLQVLRQIKNGQIVESIVDYAGNNATKVEFGIKTPQYNRGIGFVFDKIKGEYVMKTDAWNKEGEATTLIGEIVSNYQKAGHMKILAKYGYLTTVKEDKQGIMITGRAY